MHKAIRHTCVGDVGSTAGVVSTRFAVALWRRWAGGAMSGAYAPHPGHASAPLRFRRHEEQWSIWDLSVLAALPGTPATCFKFARGIERPVTLMAPAQGGAQPL